MLALSLLQPYASLLAIGAKRFETRSWAPSQKLRLPLLVALHASKGEHEFREVYADPLFLAAAERAFDGPMPRVFGAFVGVATLRRVVRTEDACTDICSDEYLFGDYTPGRYAWRFDDPVAFATPIQARGRLGLWDVGLHLDKMLRATLDAQPRGVA